MNLSKLFETQKILRDRINYQGEDRFNKLILALLVELGECANEWRGFKFWSKNQEPNISKPVNTFYGSREGLTTNPLLEEYVDGLHFVLELGLEVENEFWKTDDIIPESIKKSKLQKIYEESKSIDEQFHLVFRYTSLMLEDNYLPELLGAYINLGEMLGFTWEQIEQAYFEKNKINHERQENGY
ncbi:dUTP diphosphatase [Bacillus sp. FJAT-49736]|uniref:dUTP diphosphatase n=1 Tax=Bacillus sp. FJAT-49736 TaxID=2833582 RepID=UPI001BC911F9|nr:dUTP diphosphatase [Bacillus sp. FJAT-49736]MBS4173487.1 dUTP diphosphatase [Bacillus sp. FJAT-49736]